MPQYRFRILEADAELADERIEAHADDAEALKAALALRNHHTIEVWTGEQQLAVVKPKSLHLSG